MKKYGLLISFIIAVTFVGCTIILVKDKTKVKENHLEVKVSTKDSIKNKTK
jgi:hypothetical protein